MENNYNHIINEELLTRYLLGECTPEENTVIEQWLEAAPKNRAELRRLKTLIDMLALSKMDAETEWLSFKTKLKPQAKVVELKTHEKTGSYKFWAIAASLAVLIGLSIYFVFFFSPTPKQILAESHETVKEITLVDGSNISINRHSTLEYPEKFDKDRRLVKLKGEAYFKVNPDASRPFIVETEQFFVTVLGTAFYVRSSVGQTQEVFVESGTVKCEHKTNGENLILNAGEKYTFGSLTNTPIEVSQNDMNMNAWKTASLIFVSEKMSDIATIINHTYGCNIILNGDISNCTLTVNFEALTLDGVLNVLQTILDVQIVKNKNTIEINGNGC